MATITDAGREVLEGRDDEISRTGPKQRALGKDVTPQFLLQALRDGNGILTVPAPSQSERAAYRRALDALRQMSLSEGLRVTYQGRDRGDLVIRLINTPQAKTADTQILLPPAPDPRHPVVHALQQRMDELAVSASSHERALLIHQALADEAIRRGYTCTVPESDDQESATLLVRIGEIDVGFTMHEEKKKVQSVPDDELQKIRYDWQRAPLREVEQWSGRLVLTLDAGRWRNPWWADRKRWNLESRLPNALRAAEEYAEEVRQKREAADQAKRERRAAWEDAVPKAQAAYIDSHNRDRADVQIAAFSRSRDLRAYADAIEKRAPSLGSDASVAAIEWAAWIRAEAERTDPLSQADDLRHDVPDALPISEVDRYMPRGMTSAQCPPD